MADAKFTLWQTEVHYLFIVQMEDVLTQILSHNSPLIQLHQP